MKPIDPGTHVCPHCGNVVPCLPNSQNSLQPGYTLGRFIIGKELGRGGYGITYIAYDTRLAVVRCIKEYFPKDCRRMPDMSPEIRPGKEREFQQFSDRFLQEARMMGAVSDKKGAHVTEVYDILKFHGDIPYILMEYLDGCTMDEYISQKRSGLPWQEARDILCDVLETLDIIHKQNILHRDISLSNIFRLKDGSIRLIDFGSAVNLNDALNQPGTLYPSSKRYYSPPEQVSNSQQGPWTDLYAVGACLFKLVAGGWPRQYEANKVFPTLKMYGFSVPDKLDAILTKATDPDPRKRYQSALAMRDDLAAVQEAPAGKTKEKKGKLPLILGIGGAVVAAAGILIFTMGGNKPDTNENMAVSAEIESVSDETLSKTESPAAEAESGLEQDEENTEAENIPETRESIEEITKQEPGSPALESL